MSAWAVREQLLLPVFRVVHMSVLHNLENRCLFALLLRRVFPHPVNQYLAADAESASGFDLG